MVAGSDTILAEFVAALPDPAVAVAADGRVLHANSSARALAPGLSLGMPMVRVFRAPEVLEAVRRVRPGAPSTATWRDRVPVDRPITTCAR